MNPRPQSMSDYIGQSGIRPVIQNAIDLAKSGKRLFGPALFYGGPGLGKSSLAVVVSNETKTKLLSYTGSKDWTGTRVKKELLNLDVRGYGPGGKWQEGAIRYTLFIDEIHAIHPTAFESLYSPIENLEVQDSGTVYWLADIQWIFATTSPAKLPKPFLDRLSLQLHLEPYTVADLCTMIHRLHPAMDKDTVTAVAERSCGVARLAIGYAQSVEDYPGGLDWFSIMKIDQFGLTEFQRQYLAVLERAEGRSISLSQLASVLRESPAVVQMAEEELLRQCRIEIGPHGRSLAMIGHEGGKLRD